MTITIDAMPTSLPIVLPAGRTIRLRLIFTEDAPVGARFLGEYDDATLYPKGVVVEKTGVQYTSLRASTGVDPATTPATWRSITPLDISALTGWAAELGAGTDVDELDVDTSELASSVITVTFEDTITAARLLDGPQHWDLTYIDPDLGPVSIYAGPAILRRIGEGDGDGVGSDVVVLGRFGPNVVGVVATVAAVGRPGRDGGGGGGGDAFVFSQPTLSTAWTVAHNFGRAPAAVTVTLLSGEIVEPDRADIDVNHTVLTFSIPAAGHAVLI